MKIETHDISFSLDQPDQVLGSLLKVLQQMLNHFKMATPKKMPDYRNILIIDAEEERAQYLAHLLVRAGYRPMVMANALETFTRFLQVPFVPFTIILTQDDASNRLFLQRLLQQTVQKYEWEIPLIRLHIQPSTSVSSPWSNTSMPSLPQSSNQFTPRPFGSDASKNSNAPVHQPSNPPGPLSPHSFGFQPSNPFSSNASQPSGSFSSQSGSHSISLTPFSSSSSQNLYHSNSQASMTEERGEYKEVKKISLEGQNLGRYSITTLLGDATSSNAYKTYDRLREQDVGLKALQVDSLPYHIIERSLEEENYFEQEAELLRGLDNLHLVPVWNCGKSYVSGTPFVYKTMPYFAEGSLTNWIYLQGSAKVFSAQEVVHVVLQLAETLQFLHDHQITYQNFKMTNLIVNSPTKDMSHLHLMLADFAIPQNGSFFSRAPESFPYLAPERWYGQVFPASDQYGLAVMAYELLAGRPPFQGTSDRTMRLLHTNMQPQAPGTINPRIPSALNNVLLRALAKKPGDRFPSIMVFAKTFQQYCL